jgi:predicted Rossmann fold nucleotide-binding protein DprA/Smf involved in DNA uptake
MKELSQQELKALLDAKETFVLYVRSEMKKEKIREIFDTDIVVPELEKSLGKSLNFYYINVDDYPYLLKEYLVPAVVIFKEGKEVVKLEGIKAWNEYVEALSCL